MSTQTCRILSPNRSIFSSAAGSPKSSPKTGRSSVDLSRVATTPEPVLDNIDEPAAINDGEAADNREAEIGRVTEGIEAIDFGMRR